MRILCLTAHPDDLEVGAIGTLLKYQEQGATINSVVLVRPSGELRANRNALIVTEELSNSYSLTNFNLHVYQTPLFDNGRPNLTVDTNTITSVGKLVGNSDYDLVILPSPSDYHQDHRATYEIGMSLIARKAREIWTIDAWPYNTRTTQQGNILVDITKQWPVKVKAIKSYYTYFGEKELDMITKQASYWGSKINADYAESFTLIHRQL